MRRKRIMVVGPAGCGKTSLVNALNEADARPRRTPDMIYGPRTIDVPSSYLESRMYRHIIAASQDASCLLLLVNQSECREVYSPGFSRVFRCPVFGVITKCDLHPENEGRCVCQLKGLGIAPPYYKISLLKDVGIWELKSRLLKLTKGRGKI